MVVAVAAVSAWFAAVATEVSAAIVLVGDMVAVAVVAVAGTDAAAAAAEQRRCQRTDDSEEALPVAEIDTSGRR